MDFDIPEPFPVTHWTRPKIGKNPAGQVKYGDPVPRTRMVRGFEPAGEEEKRTAQLAGRTITDLMMLDDEGDWPADSKVEFEGQEFEVNGRVQNYNLGPFDFKPGYAIPLREVNNGTS